VVWTYVAYMHSGEDCGVWGTRSNTPDSLQNIKVGSRRSEFDDRLQIDHQRDIIVNKRMASAFFETNLGSVFNFHGVDTVVVTGGSTSGCVPPQWWTASPAATGPLFPRSAWPTNMKGRISPISTTWQSNTPMCCRLPRHSSN